MSTTTTHITGVRTVNIPVDDQDAALRFYVDTLGFTKLRDTPTPVGKRYIELAPGTDDVVVTLEPAGPNVTRGAGESIKPRGRARNARRRAARARAQAAQELSGRSAKLRD
ncbi:MAG: VOC family protein [Nocardiopsaceae bacterium]|jgi:catechol 2,3-dioxygenase-like lactoylglutathione lyase family enzyme|nr:VOC family protein [Nocardiopsaceae bacterium]